MSVTATTPARTRDSREHRPHARRQAAHRPEPGRGTLDDRISVVWAQLAETGSAECPVCGSALSAGRPCRSCGSELS